MITVGLGERSECVAIRFDTDYGITTVLMPYNQARTIADMLYSCADEVERALGDQNELQS